MEDNWTPGRNTEKKTQEYIDPRPTVTYQDKDDK